MMDLNQKKKKMKKKKKEKEKEKEKKKKKKKEEEKKVKETCIQAIVHTMIRNRLEHVLLLLLFALGAWPRHLALFAPLWTTLVSVSVCVGIGLGRRM